jgi:hypothetical protein
MKILKVNVAGLHLMEINLKGTPTHTIIAGNIKMQEGKILGDPDGTPLKFS